MGAMEGWLVDERADGIPGTCGGLGRADGAELVLEAHGMPHSDTLLLNQDMSQGQ